MGWGAERLKTAAAALVAAAAVAVVLGAAAFWFGFYNVAASRGHNPLTEQLLLYGMTRSVAVNAPDIAQPPLDDLDRIRLGAAHYANGCAFCHGAPGERAGPVLEHMLPAPPRLGAAVQDWSDAELFFIVKHGLKYTGMPAWPSQARDDEVWSIVAFLRAMPELDGAGYRELAAGRAERPEREVEAIVALGPGGDLGSACAHCHDGAERGTRSRYVPQLAGQSVEYLMRSLVAYAASERASGIMQTVAAELEPDQVERVAGFYAGLARSEDYAKDDPPDPEAAARGRAIAEGGLPRLGVPPCLSCHGDQRLESYPRLDGLSYDYLVTQLRLWRAGARGGTDQAQLMAEVAESLTDQHIADAAAYFAAAEVSP